jgi:predicted ATPase/DNA-binding SARP family transcriptional activator
VQVYRGHQLVNLGSVKQRAVFAQLVLRAGEFVSVDALLDAVWGERQPASARQLIHTYVARLRQVFEPEVARRGRDHVIGSAPSGYRLLIAGEQIDVSRYKQLLAQANRQRVIGELGRAFDLLGEAIRLWCDPELTELSALLHSSQDIVVLRQAWTDSVLNYVTIGLDLGEAPTVLPLAQRLAAAEPMHEDVQAQYLATLQQTGRRAAAVGHFNEVRARLRVELGVEPGPELAEVYRQVLLGTERRPSEHAQAVNLAVPVRPPWRGLGPGLGHLIQRDEELDSLVQILAEQRLLTLAGPPGCGKSALALQTAARLRDAFLGGVAVVECSDLTDLPQITHRLLGLLGGSPDLHDAAKMLGDQHVLIVLDDVEHLIEACAVVVDEIVRACRQVSVVVTSREPLGLPYETVWRVVPLAVPDPDQPEWPGDSPSVRLFARRATQVCTDFRLGPDNADAIATICRQLDGLPLAVEMAAACLATDTVEGVVGRLHDPLHQIQPPRRGQPAHQRSLWTALRRSVECLSDCERECFLKLGGLPLHFELQVAQQAWESTPWRAMDLRKVLTGLVDKSLLFVQHSPAGPSYRMLKLVHQFAADLGAAELI